MNRGHPRYFYVLIIKFQLCIICVYLLAFSSIPHLRQKKMFVATVPPSPSPRLCVVSYPHPHPFSRMVLLPEHHRFGFLPLDEKRLLVTLTARLLPHDRVQDIYHHFGMRKGLRQTCAAGDGNVRVGLSVPPLVRPVRFPSSVYSAAVRNDLCSTRLAGNRECISIIDAFNDATDVLDRRHQGYQLWVREICKTRDRTRGDDEHIYSGIIGKETGRTNEGSAHGLQQ